MRFAAAVLGDPWTLVLLRDLIFRGKRHFRDFLTDEAPASNILASRLERLETAGLVTRRRDPDKRNQVVYELTAKGVALVPTFLAMIEWSASHDVETEAPADFLADYRADRTGFAQTLAAKLTAGHTTIQ